MYPKILLRKSFLNFVQENKKDTFKQGNYERKTKRHERYCPKIKNANKRKIERNKKKTENLKIKKKKQKNTEKREKKNIY